MCRSEPDPVIVVAALHDVLGNAWEVESGLPDRQGRMVVDGRLC